jgi:BirA family biotin operon repressor/biotin-[acetyl-CoA-carboxylase] ligase
VIDAMRGFGADLRGAADAVAARGGALGRPLHLVSRTTSTNDLAKQAARAGAPHGSAWVAEEQSGGRGRQGRPWLSPPGESLLFSVLLRIESDPRWLPPVSVAAGLAVTEAVGVHAQNSRPLLKWPNDVLIGDRKVAGVLVEATATGRGAHAVVVGIGINVHTRAFPPDLASRATSVALEASRTPVRAELLADVLERLDRDLPVVVGRGLGLLASRIAACDGLRGEMVRCAEGLEGVAEGIDERGRLVVLSRDGTLARWSSGEVHLVRRSAPSQRF